MDLPQHYVSQIVPVKMEGIVQLLLCLTRLMGVKRTKSLPQKDNGLVWLSERAPPVLRQEHDISANSSHYPKSLKHTKTACWQDSWQHEVPASGAMRESFLYKMTNLSECLLLLDTHTRDSYFLIQRSVRVQNRTLPRTPSQLQRWPTPQPSPGWTSFSSPVFW